MADLLPRMCANVLLVATIAMVGATPAEATDSYALGVCQTAGFDIGAEIRPIIAGDMYLSDYHRNDPRFQEKLAVAPFFAGAKVTLIKRPTHGKVALVDSPVGITNSWYHYMPIAGYSGRDRFVMQLEKDRIKIRIHYLMEVLDEYDTPTGRCGRGHWKISSYSTQDNVDLAKVTSNTGLHLTFAAL